MKLKSIKLNFIMNSILSMSAFIFPLITFPYTSRVLLPEGTGKLSFATSVISYFLMLSQLGIPTYGIRACAKIRDDKKELSKTVQELFIINIFTMTISYIILVPLIFFVPQLACEKKLFFVMSFSILLSSIGFEWLYKALEQYTYITIRSLIFKIISIGSMFMFVHSKEDYIIYALISVLASSASNVMNLINLRKIIIMKPIGNYCFKKHIKAVVVFFAMSCATVIYTHLDVVMLGFCKGDVEVGYYNAAVKIKTILVSIVTSLGAVLLPRASYYIKQKRIDEFKVLIKKSFKFIFVIAIPMVVYFVIFSKEGIRLLSGNEYDSSIIPMQIITICVLFMGLSNVTGIQILIPMEKEKIVFKSTCIGALVDIIINTLLIPKLGAIGAAIGTLVAEIIVFIVQYLYLLRIKFNFSKEMNIWKILVATMISAIVSLYIKFLNMPNIVTLIISATVFGIIYLLSLLIFKEKFVIDLIYDYLKKEKKNGI